MCKKTIVILHVLDTFIALSTMQNIYRDFPTAISKCTAYIVWKEAFVKRTTAPNILFNHNFEKVSYLMHEHNYCSKKEKEKK